MRDPLYKYVQQAFWLQKQWIIEKISYKRCAYELVDDLSLYKVISQIQQKKKSKTKGRMIRLRRENYFQTLYVRCCGLSYLLLVGLDEHGLSNWNFIVTKRDMHFDHKFETAFILLWRLPLFRIWNFLIFCYCLLALFWGRSKGPFNSFYASLKRGQKHTLYYKQHFPTVSLKQH